MLPRPMMDPATDRMNSTLLLHWPLSSIFTSEGGSGSGAWTATPLRRPALAASPNGGWGGQVKRWQVDFGAQKQNRALVSLPIIEFVLVCLTGALASGGLAVNAQDLEFKYRVGGWWRGGGEGEGGGMGLKC